MRRLWSLDCSKVPSAEQGCIASLVRCRKSPSNDRSQQTSPYRRSWPIPAVRCFDLIAQGSSPGRLPDQGKSGHFWRLKLPLS